MSKGILGLEISPRRIRYIYLQRKVRKLTISHTGNFFFDEEITSSKNSRLLSSAIQEILHKEHIAPSKICLTISGKEMFIHLMDLPKMSDSELREVIITEIEKVPSFAEKEFDYIYSTFNLGEQRTRVLFTAISKELLDFYIRGAIQGKTYLESLEVSPINLLSVLSHKLKGESSEALLVLDDDFSQIIIFSKQGHGLFYNMPTGKTHLFPAGSQQLDKSAFFGWTEEIRRVFRSYMREVKRKEINRLWFIWDDENAKGLDRFLDKEMILDVACPSLNSLGVEMANKAEEFNPAFFIPLIAPYKSLKRLKSRFFFGHFLRGLKVKEAIKKTSVFTSIFILLVGSLFGKITINYIASRNDKISQDSRLADRVNNLESQTTELRKERAGYLEAKERLLEQATFVRRLNRISTSEVFAGVFPVLPDDISLQSFELTESGTVKLRGFATKIDTLAEFIRKINDTVYFNDVKFDYLREKEIRQNRVIEFDIYTTLKSKADEKE